MPCGSSACWLCPTQGYVEVNELEIVDGEIVTIVDPGGPLHGTPTWDDLTAIELPEVTLFRLVQEETDRQRRTSGTTGLKIQACTELERFGFEMEGLLCADNPIFCYMPRGDCKNFRFHIDRSGDHYWQIAARIGVFDNVEFDIDEGTEVEWSITLLGFNINYVVDPVWPVTVQRGDCAVPA